MRNGVESNILAHLRRGELSILAAITVELPDVFYDEILPKLNLKDTYNLGQVNRAYRDAVWSAEGVRSLGTKVEDHVDDKQVQDPMYFMARNGNSRAVRALLESGVDVNKVYSFTISEQGLDDTALHVAARMDHAVVALELIDAGADLNERDISGETPLYNAVECGHTSVVMALLKSGADVNLLPCDWSSDRSSDTLLEVAIRENYETIAALLISCGADIRKVDNDLRNEAKHFLNEEEFGDVGKLIRVAERLAPSE